MSLVLATLKDQYVDASSPTATPKPRPIMPPAMGYDGRIRVFSDAARIAAEQSADLVITQIESLRTEWTARLTTYRASQGLRESPRADSATARLLEMPPEAVVLTAGTLQHILGVSYLAASGALDELRQAAIHDTRRSNATPTAYLAAEVLDLIKFSKRKRHAVRHPHLWARSPRLSTPPRSHVVVAHLWHKTTANTVNQ